LSHLPPKTVSELLADWDAGDEKALRAAVPIVYDELRRVARHYLRNERPGHTLQSAAIVHESYLRLEKQGAAQFKNREHFLAVCAQLNHSYASGLTLRAGGFPMVYVMFAWGSNEGNHTIFNMNTALLGGLRVLPCTEVTQGSSRQWP
jgi:hypothetical protein